MPKAKCLLINRITAMGIGHRER